MLLRARYAELVAVVGGANSCASCVSAGASGSARGMTDAVQVEEVEARADEDEDEVEADEAAVGEADENDVGTAGGLLVVVVLPASEEAAGGSDKLGFVL